ncbi:MAG: hypothetical protein IID38_04360 [Planctomycetes bacterium]|nr:hypothetical protein [Planctomycetota bacterium]
MLLLKTYIGVYPWDLLDEGLDGVLDRLHGEVGVSGVVLWVGCPRLMQLRVRAVEPRIFRTRGGLFFQPSLDLYAGTRCKPIVSDQAKNRDPLAKISSACLARGLEVRVMLSAAATGRLAERYPEMACKNVFGAGSQTSLCLCNSDVQAYLCALVADVSAREGVGAVVLTDLVTSWSEAHSGSLSLAVPPGGTASSLLGLCFCESCQQKASGAGVDVAMAHRWVQQTLQRCLDRGPVPVSGTGLDAPWTDHPPMVALDEWRVQEHSSLLRRLVEACRCELLLDRKPYEPELSQQKHLDCTLPAGVMTRVDRADQLSSAMCRTARRNELRLAETLTASSNAPELVRLFSQATEQGFTGIQIDHYGRLPDTTLTAIRQAVRIARRTVGDGASPA